MKYIRKTVALIISVLFIASLAIGLCVIFAVRNVNVTLFSYSYQAESVEAEEKIAEFKKSISSAVHGNLMASVSEEKVAEAVKNDDGSFTVVALKKIYPCTLNVTIEERREVFSVKAEDGSYKIYDENGVLLRTAASVEENINPDGTANLVVESAGGTDFNGHTASIAKTCTLFAEKFKSLRAVAERAEFYQGIHEDFFALYLKCGARIVIWNHTVLTAEKIEAAYGEFLSLDGNKKLNVEIHCSETSDGLVNVTHR